MPKYRTFFIQGIIKIAFAILISFCLVSPARAITQELQLDTNQGYKVRATFSYDETEIQGAIEESGHGKTKVIDSMQVSFYNPSEELVASYDNIVDGVVVGNYFEFNFDPKTTQMIGNIDIGGESAGEMYLKGDAKQELLLIEVSKFGEEKAIDLVSQSANN